MPTGLCADKERKGLCEEARSNETGDAGEPRNGPLELALLGAAHAAGHERLRGRTGEAPEGHDGNPRAIDPSVGRHAVDRKAQPAAEQSCEEGLPLSEASRERPHKQPLYDHGADAGAGQHEANRLRVPLVAIAHIQHRDARQDGMPEVAKKDDRRETEEFAMRPQQFERADRIGPLPGKAHTLLVRERLRQDEESIAGVHQTRRRRAPEWEPRIDHPEQPAHRRAEYEA